MVQRISVAMAVGALIAGTALSGPAPAAESTPTSFSGSDRADDVKIAKGARKKAPLKVLRSIDLRTVKVAQLDAETAQVQVTFKRKPARAGKWARTVSVIAYPDGDDNAPAVQLSDNPGLLDDRAQGWNSATLSLSDGYNWCYLEPTVTRTSVTVTLPARCGWGSVSQIEVRAELYRTRLSREGSYLVGRPLSRDRANFGSALVWQ